MTPRERRHYDALLSMQLTLSALRRFHEYYISQEMGQKIHALQVALTDEMNRIQVESDAAEKARGA